MLLKWWGEERKEEKSGEKKRREMTGKAALDDSNTMRDRQYFILPSSLS